MIFLMKIIVLMMLVIFCVSCNGMATNVLFVEEDEKLNSEANNNRDEYYDGSWWDHYYYDWPRYDYYGGAFGRPHNQPYWYFRHHRHHHRHP